MHYMFDSLVLSRCSYAGFYKAYGRGRNPVICNSSLLSLNPVEPEDEQLGENYTRVIIR